MGRRLGVSAAVLACVVLAGCSSQQDAPPTDAAILRALWAFWHESLPTYTHISHEYYEGLLSPVAAKVIGEWPPKEAADDARVVVEVSYSYEALFDISYDCDSHAVVHVRARPVDTGLVPYPHSAHAREIISCSGPATFIKSDKGWVMHFDTPQGVTSDYPVR